MLYVKAYYALIDYGVNMKKFDKEYSTQWIKEVQWLSSQGIKYSFVKVINNITTYKYEKTSELFKALAIFYD